MPGLRRDREAVDVKGVGKYTGGGTCPLPSRLGDLIKESIPQLGPGHILDFGHSDG